jgi:soluble lytic murein transglycosylase
LALEKLGRNLPYDIMRRNVKLQWRNAEFIQSTVFQAAILMLAADEKSLAERFLTHLSEDLSEQNLLKLESFLIELDDPHIQIRFGKRQAGTGIIMFNSYFALHDMVDYQWVVPSDLLLSIARRESEFDQNAKSSAGAMGLMQVMPGTAKDMAKVLQIPFEEESLLTSWKYNVLLGATYLQELSYKYRGNPILIATAYNAGPTNADKWIENLGNPLDRTTDLIDWVEMIPFRETRNYVMRITESLTLYKALVEENEIDHNFSEFLGSSAYFSFTPKSE